MQRVLVSACLLGHTVRYNGMDQLYPDPILQRWLDEGRVIPVCPELAGGLSVPRPASEITGGADGLQVFSGAARVVDAQGQDYSAAFTLGAEKILAQAREQGARIAVLKEGSPSCGSHYIYDGSFRHQQVPHRGVTAAYLCQAGLSVFCETEFAAADALLLQLDLQ